MVASPWLRGNDDSKYSALPTVYSRGEGVNQDYEKALYWFRMACNTGSQKGCGSYRMFNE